jgi:hypothetical protein
MDHVLHVMQTVQNVVDQPTMNAQPAIQDGILTQESAQYAIHTVKNVMVMAPVLLAGVTQHLTEVTAYVMMDGCVIANTQTHASLYVHLDGLDRMIRCTACVVLPQTSQ